MVSTHRSDHDGLHDLSHARAIVMFSIDRVELHNFKSYVGAHEWVLPTEPGLYFITGQNLVHDLDRCGCGKTTLLDAICWALTDRTTRNQRGPEVVATGQKTCSVAVYGNLRGEAFEVVKTQSPNGLTVNGGVTDQASLTKLLGLNHEAFCYSVILPQFGDAFFDLSPSAKLDLFSQIMELDSWLELSENANDKAKASLIEQGSLEKELLKLEVEIKHMEGDIKEYQTMSGKWASAKGARIEAYKSELNALTKRIAGIEDKLESLNTESLEIEGKLNLLDPKNLVNSDMAVTTRKITDLKLFAGNLDKVKARCPTCHQEVDSQHLMEEQKKAIEETKSLERVLKNLTNLDQEIKKLRSTALTKAREMVAARENLGICQFHEKGAKKNLEVEQNTTNEFEPLISQKKAYLEEAEMNLFYAKEDLEDLQQEYEATKFWINGFKRIRLLIIEATLRAFEVEVNNVLSSLNLTSWGIKFDIEHENKSGGITKGFSVFIHEAERDRVSWHSWSGGETQYLRLAGALGLSNLIMERAGLDSEVEFYDEISQHLTPRCTERFFETLHYRAHSLGKKIFVIDHNSYDTDLFDGKVFITKNENGSSIKISYGG